MVPAEGVSVHHKINRVGGAARVDSRDQVRIGTCFYPAHFVGDAFIDVESMDAEIDAP
jgi:hypothetical protein